MFDNFLKDVKRAAGDAAEGAGKTIERDAERAVDKAAKRWAKQAAKTIEQRAAKLLSGFLSPEPESDSDYYARTGTLREDDWG